jgi:hypothetical protein
LNTDGSMIAIDTIAVENEVADRELKEVYKTEGAEERFLLKKYPVAHLETAEMRADIVEFLKNWL